MSDNEVIGEIGDSGEVGEVEEKETVKVKKKGAATKKSQGIVEKKEEMEKIHVTVEMERHVVLEYDRKGYELVFEVDPFKVLPDAMYKDLSRKNQLQYTIAQHGARELERRRKQNDGDAPSEKVITTRLRTGQALNKINKMEDDVYFHRYWAAPHEVDDCEDAGYGKDPDQKTIMREGKPELIPMRIPVERYDRHQEGVVRESRDRIRRAEEEFETSGVTNRPGMRAINQTTRTKVRLSDLEQG